MFITPNQDKNKCLKRFLQRGENNQANQRVGLFPFLYFFIPLSAKEDLMLLYRSLHRFVFMKREIVPTMKTSNSFGIPYMI